MEGGFLPEMGAWAVHPQRYSSELVLRPAQTRLFSRHPLTWAHLGQHHPKEGKKPLVVLLGILEDSFPVPQMCELVKKH